MEKKIEVFICTGTVCYVMGGADLLLLEERLPEELKKLVVVKGTPCLEACTQMTGQKPPFVSINGTVYGEASVDSVIGILNSIKE